MHRFSCACGQSCAWYTVDQEIRTGFWSALAYCLHCGEETFLGGGSLKEAELVLAKFRALECYECGTPIDAHTLWGGGYCGSCVAQEARDNDWKERKRYRRPPKIRP